MALAALAPGYGGARSGGSGSSRGAGGSGTGGRTTSGRSAGGAGAGRSGQKKAGARGAGGRGAKGRPAPSNDPLVILAKWLFQVSGAGWMLVAGAAGFGARRFGRSARDLHPDHRRDGVGLFWLGLAILLGAGIWARMHNAVGQGIYIAASSVFGELAFAIPLLAAMLAWRYLRHPDRGTQTAQVAIGWSALTIGALGLIHIAKGTPALTAGTPVIRSSGGFLGFLVSWPLVHLVTVWVATPLLGLVAGFGVLVITGTPVHQIPERLGEFRQVFGYGQPDGVPGEYEDSEDDDLDLDDDGDARAAPPGADPAIDPAAAVGDRGGRAPQAL